MALVFPPESSACADHAICASGLSKQFGGDYVVRDLNFHIPYGAIFGFIGPSGSGKTTTIRLLTGTYSPSEGEVLVLGSHPADFTREQRERLGYMPQSFSLYPDLSVWENLNFSASLYALPMRRQKKLDELLEFVDLSPHRRKLVRDLSGGMKRRLSLAATLVQDPQMIFLDEPTAGVDPVLRNKFWDGFHRLKAEGRTMFITTQYISEVTYCDLVGVMNHGRLLSVDTPDGLRRQVFGGEVLDVELTAAAEWGLTDELERLPFVRGQVQMLSQEKLRVVVDEASTASPELLAYFSQQKVGVTSIQEYFPPFDDVFVHLIEKEDRAV